MYAVPPVTAVTVHGLLPLVPAAAPAVAVDDELQVSVGVMYVFVVSYTSAVSVCVPSGARVKVVLLLLASCTTMLWTGQVRYGVPTLLTPETLAKTVVMPGASAASTPL